MNNIVTDELVQNQTINLITVIARKHDFDPTFKFDSDGAFTVMMTFGKRRSRLRLLLVALAVIASTEFFIGIAFLHDWRFVCAIVPMIAAMILHEQLRFVNVEQRRMFMWAEVQYQLAHTFGVHLLLHDAD